MDANLIASELSTLNELLKSKNTSKPLRFANPGPIGLFAFGVTTLFLSFYNVQVFFDATTVKTVSSLAFFSGGLVQFIAGAVDFSLNNIFGATAFTSYGGFWVAFGFLDVFVKPQLKQVTTSADFEGSYLAAIGGLLLTYTIMTTILWFASFSINKVTMILFGFLDVTFLILTIGHLCNHNLTNIVGGWFGIVTSLIAFYSGAATIINETWKCNKLPLGPGGFNFSFMKSRSVELY